MPCVLHGRAHQRKFEGNNRNRAIMGIKTFWEVVNLVIHQVDEVQGSLPQGGQLEP